MRPRPHCTQWAAAALAVAALAGCSGDDNDGGAATRTLDGTFTIRFAGGNDAPCAPADDHPDLVDGAPVVVTDGAGNVVAQGTLGDGTAKFDACVRSFEVVGVPDVAGFRVSVGSYGPIDVTADALEAAGGALDLRLGL
ncbi:MAG: hypothetical protein RL238_2487 [Actinomycetota bacterium]|jgi:hypothetical protein